MNCLELDRLNFELTQTLDSSSKTKIYYKSLQKDRISNEFGQKWAEPRPRSGKTELRTLQTQVHLPNLNYEPNTGLNFLFIHFINRTKFLILQHTGSVVMCRVVVWENRNVTTYWMVIDYFLFTIHMRILRNWIINACIWLISSTIHKCTLRLKSENIYVLWNYWHPDIFSPFEIKVIWHIICLNKKSHYNIFPIFSLPICPDHLCLKSAF